jgi:Anti-sigma-K factor rskA/Putative zinc-finger
MSTQPMSHEHAVDLAPLYVLGALEASEMASIRDHLRTCPEAHDEFAELGGTVPYLVDTDDLKLVEPPASLRDRIMAAAAGDLAARQSATPAERPATPAAPRPVPAPPAAPLPFPSVAERTARASAGTRGLDWALRIAAVVAIVVVGGWNLFLQGQLRDTRSQLGATASQLAEARAYEGAVAAVISAAGEKGSKAVILTPTENSTASGIAAVRTDGSVVLAMRDLPPTAGTEVYETWVIVGTAAPVAIGSFKVEPSGIASFTTRPADAPVGAVIALSREPAPGSTAPLGPIVSTGVAVAPAG